VTCASRRRWIHCERAAPGKVDVRQAPACMSRATQSGRQGRLMEALPPCGMPALRERGERAAASLTGRSARTMFARRSTAPIRFRSDGRLHASASCAMMRSRATVSSCTSTVGAGRVHQVSPATGAASPCVCSGRRRRRPAASRGADLRGPRGKRDLRLNLDCRERRLQFCCVSQVRAFSPGVSRLKRSLCSVSA
jgi:hypothetical protein